MIIRTFRETDESAVIRLWTDCGLVRPWNDPRRDIERKLAEQPELFLVGEVGESGESGQSSEVGELGEPHGRVVATAMVGYDGHRGWVYYVAVDPSRQGHSLGRALMDEAERLLLERGCPKLNLQIRAGNEKVIGFYRALGYAQDDVVSMGKRLIPD